jgi:hypothetical protein
MEYFYLTDEGLNIQVLSTNTEGEPLRTVSEQTKLQQIRSVWVGEKNSLFYSTFYSPHKELLVIV